VGTSSRGPPRWLLVVGIVGLVLVVGFGFVLLAGGDDDGEEAVATSEPRDIRSATDPLFREGDTFVITGARRIDQFPEDCPPDACGGPAPGSEYFLVALTMTEPSDVVVPTPTDRLEVLSDELRLEHSDGQVESSVGYGTSGETDLEVVFEVPEGSSDFLLIWPDGAALDLEDVNP
jgi:hypothetical protein